MANLQQHIVNAIKKYIDDDTVTIYYLALEDQYHKDDKTLPFNILFCAQCKRCELPTKVYLFIKHILCDSDDENYQFDLITPYFRKFNYIFELLFLDREKLYDIFSDEQLQYIGRYFNADQKLWQNVFTVLTQNNALMTYLQRLNDDDQLVDLFCPESGLVLFEDRSGVYDMLENYY